MVGLYVDGTIHRTKSLCLLLRIDHTDITDYGYRECSHIITRTST